MFLPEPQNQIWYVGYLHKEQAYIMAGDDRE